MTVSTPPLETSSSHRRKHRPSRPGRRLLRFLSAWWVEILVVLLVAFGIFLLVEQWHIRQTLLGWLRQGLAAAGSFQGAVRQRLVAFIRQITLSDALGYAMLLLAFAFVAWRTRYRLMTLPRFTERQCPRCGSDLHRIHRHSLDRLINVFVPVRRYRCGNHDCGWRGLRVGKSRQE